MFAQMGGVMAERVTDLRDIGKRVTAHLVGRARARRPHARASRRCSSPRTSRPPTPPGLDPSLVVALVTEKGGSTSHTAIIARQLGIPCIVGVAGALDLPDGDLVLVDGVSGEVRWARTRPRRTRGWPPTSRRARRWPGGPAPAATARRHPGQAAGQRADGASARHGRRRRRPRAWACSAPSCASSAARTSRASRSRPTSTPRCSRLRRRPVRRAAHPRRRLGQAARLRHPAGRGEPGARRPRSAARLRNPGLLDRQLDGDRRGRARAPAPSPG